MTNPVFHPAMHDSEYIVGNRLVGHFTVDLEFDCPVFNLVFGHNALYDDLYELVMRSLGRTPHQYISGTAYLLVSDKATSPGRWHTDPGSALRYAMTYSFLGENWGHEFRDGVSPNAEIVKFTKDEHRRPETGPGLRLFGSVGFYVEDKAYDLSCPQLSELRPFFGESNG